MSATGCHPPCGRGRPAQDMADPPSWSEFRTSRRASPPPNPTSWRGRRCHSGRLARRKSGSGVRRPTDATAPRRLAAARSTEVAAGDTRSLPRHRPRRRLPHQRRRQSDTPPGDDIHMPVADSTCRRMQLVDGTRWRLSGYEPLRHRSASSQPRHHMDHDTRHPRTRLALLPSQKHRMRRAA